MQKLMPNTTLVTGKDIYIPNNKTLPSLSGCVQKITESKVMTKPSRLLACAVEYGKISLSKISEKSPLAVARKDLKTVILVERAGQQLSTFSPNTPQDLGGHAKQ
eukprot:3103287-Karenia_brevis.AAC.1